MYMVDLKSLMEFKALRDLKKDRQRDYSNGDLSTTCTNHAYNHAVPKILTKEVWKCCVCDS